MGKFTKEVKIGIVSIFSLLLLYYGINYLKGINLMKPANYYYVVFHNVNGLTVSSPVFVDGYKAGLVRSFEYNYEHPGNIIVEISMDKEMRIAKGSVAEYKSEMLSSAAISLKLNLDGKDFYQPGDTLPSERSVSLMDKVEKDMLPKLAQVLSRMDTVLAGLQKVVSNPALNKSVDNLQGTTDQLNKSSKALAGMMQKDVPQIVDNLNKVTKDFSIVSSNIKTVNFAQTMSAVDSTMQNIKTFTGQLNKSDNTMGLLLKNRALYDSLSTTVGSANQLMVDLKSHPKRYVHFSVFGRK